MKMKNMKEKFNKDIGFLKKSQIEVLEMKKSLSQIKNSGESLCSRLNQV
jgi:hypothetical protein